MPALCPGVQTRAVIFRVGELIPVTVIEATPNVVLQVKTVETDGYLEIMRCFPSTMSRQKSCPFPGRCKWGAFDGFAIHVICQLQKRKPAKLY